MWRCDVQVVITYEYLRGTRDEGSYLGPSRVLINKRRMREVRLRNQSHGFNRSWQIRAGAAKPPVKTGCSLVSTLKQLMPCRVLAHLERSTISPKW